MSDEPKWPNQDELEGYMKDPLTLRKDLEFTFRFNTKYGPLPFAIGTDPNLLDLDDTIILLIVSTAIRTLASRHGLEEALKKINEVAYGRIDGKRAFKISGCYIEKEEFEHPNHDDQ